MENNTTIYISLIDEGVEVWRPVEAEKISNNAYKILQSDDYDITDEIWAFPPGTIVNCKNIVTPDGQSIFAAVGRNKEKSTTKKQEITKN